MTMTKLIAKRKKWLADKGLSIRQFAEFTGNDYGTAFKWFDEARNPRRKYLDAVLGIYPDFPLA